MKNIELVIKIPEEIRLLLINNIKLSPDQQFICDSYIKQAVINSTPLPKGHGRLIDADALERKMCGREEKLGDDRAMWESSVVSVALDMFAPTIIEADKKKSEE